MESKGRILLGICGGIAAYKIPNLVSLLVQQSYQVRVILSKAGAHFVSGTVLEALSSQAVYSDLWQEYQGNAQSPVLHIALVDEADIFLVAPASYNWIGKAAAGIADDLLSTVFSAWPIGDKPLLFAPAMNPEMWNKNMLKNNLSILQEQGCALLQPTSGFLACRAEGPGRMMETEELYFHLESRLRFLSYGVELPLCGKKLLLSIGPTRENLDPVRYISNRSSGKTGIALACAARDLGAEVTIISGIQQPNLDTLRTADPLAQQLFGIQVLQCTNAVEMAQHAEENFSKCDWALAVAAVCDFRPVQFQSQKIKKMPGEQIYQLELQLNPDILAYWGKHKSSTQKVLGFALEYMDNNEHAKSMEKNYALEKLHSKNADAIVLNRPENLDGSQSQAELLLSDEYSYTLSLKDKREFAAELLLQLCKRWL